MKDLKTIEVAFFAISTLFVLLGGVVAVAAKNPIRGAMGLLVTILGIAGMYLMLAAELLAAVQVVVYAGAVVVLFLFVIMLLGPSAAETSDARGAVSRYFGAIAFAVAGIGALWAIMRIGGEMLTALPPPPAGLGSIELIGRELFSKQIVPFQIAGVLLTIAVVGAMAIARGRGPGDPLAPKPEPGKLRASFSPLADTTSPAAVRASRLEENARRETISREAAR